MIIETNTTPPPKDTTMTPYPKKITTTITFTTTIQLNPNTPLDNPDAIYQDIHTQQPHLENHVSYYHLNGHTATVEHEEEIIFPGTVFDYLTPFTELAKQTIAKRHGQQCADNIIKYEQN